MLNVLSTGFSLGVDGPGLRLVVYLKGCNLRCPWCAAPESWRPEPEVLFYADRAEDPLSVPALCPHGAILFDGTNWQRATETCMSCAGRECLSSGHRSFELAGYDQSVEDLVALAERYRPFIGQGGGVTIGGGEPTLQFAELAELLASLQSAGFHTAIETNGTHPELPSLFGLIDLLYIDLKHPDHARYMPPVDGTVRANISARFASRMHMVVRIPLVEGFNDEAPFGPVLASIGPLQVEVLPFHRRGDAKWAACGRAVPYGALRVPSAETVLSMKESLQASGLVVV